MNRHHSFLFTVVAIYGCFFTQPGRAKDGLFFKDAPPIVMRNEGLLVSEISKMDWNARPRIHFTNASDEIIHGVVISFLVAGERRERTIIDTIAPHATSTLDFPEMSNVWYDVKALDPKPIWDFEITCKDFTKPLEGKFQWVKMPEASKPEQLSK